MEQKNHIEAQKFFRYSIEFRHKNLSLNNQDIGIYRNNFGDTNMEQKKY